MLQNFLILALIKTEFIIFFIPNVYQTKRLLQTFEIVPYKTLKLLLTEVKRAMAHLSYFFPSTKQLLTTNFHMRGFHSVPQVGMPGILDLSRYYGSKILVVHCTL